MRKSFRIEQEGNPSGPHHDCTSTYASIFNILVRLRNCRSRDKLIKLDSGGERREASLLRAVGLLFEIPL